MSDEPEQRTPAEEAQAAARDTIPAGRLGSSEEIAAAATCLCSAPASYITGTTLHIDGGVTARRPG